MTEKQEEIETKIVKCKKCGIAMLTDDMSVIKEDICMECEEK